MKRYIPLIFTLIYDGLLMCAVWFAQQHYFWFTAILLLVPLVILRENSWAISASFLLAWSVGAYFNGNTVDFFITASLIGLGIMLEMTRLLLPKGKAPHGPQRRLFWWDVSGALVGLAAGWLLFSLSCPVPWWEIQGSEPTIYLARIQGCFLPIYYSGGEWEFQQDIQTVFAFVQLVTVRNPFNWGIAVAAFIHTVHHFSILGWLWTGFKGYLTYTFLSPCLASILITPIYIPLLIIGESRVNELSQEGFWKMYSNFGFPATLGIVIVVIMAVQTLSSAFMIGLSVWFPSRKYGQAP